MKPTIIWEEEKSHCPRFYYNGHRFQYMYSTCDICAQVLRADGSDVIQKCFGIDEAGKAKAWLERQARKMKEE